jgi:hypothetical protein
MRNFHVDLAFLTSASHTSSNTSVSITQGATSCSLQKAARRAWIVIKAKPFMQIEERSIAQFVCPRAPDSMGGSHQRYQAIHAGDLSQTRTFFGKVRYQTHTLTIPSAWYGTDPHCLSNMWLVRSCRTTHSTFKRPGESERGGETLA